MVFFQAAVPIIPAEANTCFGDKVAGWAAQAFEVHTYQQRRARTAPNKRGFIQQCPLFNVLLVASGAALRGHTAIIGDSLQTNE